ncbi:MAG: hypothetical protein ACFE9Q_05975 [Candidatus Hodarchaeota archaeon]
MNKYYCNKCDKYHYRGKIYREHLDFKREKISKDISADDKELEINFKKLRPIAKRQLQRLFKKAKHSGNHELYKKEIIKLIENEKRG